MVISAADLAGIRTSVNALLPEICVNNRTGATIPCLVDVQSKLVRVPGLPTFMAPTRWDFTLPYTADVQVSDQLTRSGGTFEVLQIDASDSNVVQTVAYTVKLGTNPIVSNATVAFKRAAVSTAQIAVYIRPSYLDVRLQVYGTEFQYQMFYPPGVTISGKPLQEGDFVYWSGLTSGRASLHHPTHFAGPLPFDTTLLTEIT